MTSTATRRSLALGLAALTVLTVSACGDSGGDDAAPDTLLVGVAMPTTTSDRWIADGENLEAQLTSLGYQVDLEYAEDDVQTQVDQIGAMLDAGASALVVGAIDGTALKQVLGRAGDAGVPVISYDRLIRDSDDVAFYASFDNAKVGVLQGTSLLQGLGVLDASGEKTGAKGPFQVELFAGSTDDNNAKVFYDGAMSVLQPYLDAGVLEVPSGQTDFETIATAGWKGEVAAERMATLLEPYQGGVTLDGVLSPYDGISRAILDTVASGLPDAPAPQVTGQDAELDSAKLIAKGEQLSTIYKDTRQLAEVTVVMVNAALAGADPEVNDVTSYDNGAGVVPAYLLAPQLVTKDNYRAVLVDGGYYSAKELG
ncbi:multiple monosaccharide ABC transporter substrate-binding protein [Cellulomonas gilvus]|uniref:Multiple monosaccharide-binding protein n=1 Tax=Cellulomonas gilvus (strain ATCC 13127 / NRRL B-14078) TaxID=593907 RepID=F8A5Z3_CELGA|nr:multiple monosaccharide ABC transporter substrate-binding protein [Cellulomonas gilvus]AEI11008.1 multiple monosaccharide-binding protein [Cellulomonas gilvus ATCC 13127]